MKPLTGFYFLQIPLPANSRRNQNWPHITGGDWYYCCHIQSSFIGVTARFFFFFFKWLCNRALPRRCVALVNGGCLLTRLIEFTWKTWLLKDWWCLSLLRFRVRVFDLRTASSVASLYAHHLGVTAVQGDDWKIVSGGGEGLVCVWELRMRAKLWEMHNRWVCPPPPLITERTEISVNPCICAHERGKKILMFCRVCRHPVRHVRFNTSTLVTANIPDDKSPRGACITDDDLTAHRRSLPFASGFKAKPLGGKKWNTGSVFVKKKKKKACSSAHRCKMFVSSVGKKRPKWHLSRLFRQWLGLTLTPRATTNCCFASHKASTIQIITCLRRCQGWRMVVLHHIYF